MRYSRVTAFLARNLRQPRSKEGRRVVEKSWNAFRVIHIVDGLRLLNKAQRWRVSMNAMCLIINDHIEQGLLNAYASRPADLRFR